MDLRQEFDKILDGYGHHILMVRSSRKIKCICWDEVSRESSIEKYEKITCDYNHTKCPRCFGTGWVSRIERHKVRQDNASQIISLPNLKKLTPVGHIASDAMTFFMRHDTAPQKGDAILEVGWNKDKPTHLMRAFEISAVDPLRGQNGRIEFYQVSTKEKNIDLSSRRWAVRRLGRMKNYEPVGKKIDLKINL